MKTFSVPEIAAKFGVTEAQVRAQFLRNAANIRKEAVRIRAGGKNPNDFNPEFLDAKAAEYEQKGQP